MRPHQASLLSSPIFLVCIPKRMNTRICPDIVVLVFWIKQKWKHLAVVDIGKGNRISMDEAMDNIDANTVLLTVVTEAILLCPASV